MKQLKIIFLFTRGRRSKSIQRNAIYPTSVSLKTPQNVNDINKNTQSSHRVINVIQNV